MADDAVPWSFAWRRAAHGDDGFYGAPHGRAEDHFVTSVMSGGTMANRVVDIAEPAMRALVADGQALTVTDVGAGDGRLLDQLRGRWPHDLMSVTSWRGIDVRERPPALDRSIEWHRGDVESLVERIPLSPGLVVAHELLDDIPCDVVERDDTGHLRLVLVDPKTGLESIGEPLAHDGADSIWCREWWPRSEPAARIEIGRSRDRAWASIASLISDGVAIAVDYGHVRVDRRSGRFDGGTLTGYADGRVVRPVPNGRCNITAHVALDSCAAATSMPHSRLWQPDPGTDFWWLVQSTRPIPTTMAT